MEIRDVFFSEVYQLLCAGEDIAVVTADLIGGEYLTKIKNEFPERYISVGIAEQDLILVGSGLAMQGKKVICWGMNPFIVSRTLDQIDNSISLMHLPVTIVAFHAGLSFATTGPSHAGTRDISRIRTCDFMKCINPMDYSSVRDSVRCFLKQEQGLYIRLDKDITWESMVEGQTDGMEDGVELIHCGTSPIAVITTGLHVKMVSDLLGELKKHDVDPTVVSVLTFPFDEKKLVSYIDNSDKIITVEEMLLQGGMSAAVLEAMSLHHVLKRVDRIGIDVRNGHPSFYGRRDDLQQYLELDREHILNKILKIAL